MKRLRGGALAGFALLAVRAPAQENAVLRLVQTIALPNVEGRIDHLGIDLKRQRLFMAALGNNTLEVFDLRAGTRVRTVTGLHEPQGVYVVPDGNRVFVANGEGGTLKIYDGESFKLVREVKFSDDADNVRYDSAAQQMYVGYGEGALGIIDAQTGRHLGDIQLMAHPESFQLEATGPRLFVNVPRAWQITVIDRTRRVVVAQWPLDGYQANYPMALDEADHRLFIACRIPAELVVLDTESGKVVAHLPCAGDADDMFYDAARRRIYISGGEGFLSVIAQKDANHYEPMAKIPTAPGARTSCFVPALSRLYLAVPHRGAQRAELRVYDVGR